MNWKYDYLRLISRLDFFVFFLVLFSISFGKSFFVPILFCWFCLVFLSYFIHRDFSYKHLYGILIFPVIFYLLHGIGYLESSNSQGAIFDMQLKSSLFLFPLLFPFYRKDYKNNFNTFCFVFILGCVFSSLLHLGYAASRSYNYINGVLVFNPIASNGVYNYFFGVEFSFLLHPSYFSLYILVSLFCLGLGLWINRNKGILIRLFILFCFVTLLCTLILLQSRAGLLGFVLLAFVWLLYLIFFKRKIVLGIVVVAGFIFILSILLNKNERFSTTLKSLDYAAKSGIDGVVKEDETLVRVWIWKSALSVIVEHPMCGVGTGDVRDDMQKQFEKLGMVNAAKERLNAHNQYLETWLGVGIFGLLALLAMIFVPLWVGIKKQDWLLVGFICLCSVSFMFESMLNSIAGVGFFAIFYTMLVSRGGLEASGNTKPV